MWIIRAIDSIATRYNDAINDIAYNSTSRTSAYFRGYALGGTAIATLCAVLWSRYHGGDSPSAPPPGLLVG